MDAAQRFWSKVNKTETCWLWTAGAPMGYGAFALGQKKVKAHRFSWELAYGRPDPALDVCHRCDNPLCVRPDHLFLGTARDNIRDMFEKKRKNHRGTHNPACKLTERQARMIKFLAGKGYTHTCLAQGYGVSPVLVKKIRQGKVWSWL